jgi:hypothetical protein
MPERAVGPPFNSRCLDFGCDTNGCPFERAEDAPADCSRTIEHRDAVRVLAVEPPFDSKTPTKENTCTDPDTRPSSTPPPSSS